MPYSDVIDVGGFALRLWVLTTLLGAFAALPAARWGARRLGLPPEAVEEVLVTLLVGAGAGAVLVNVAADRLHFLQRLAGAGPYSPLGALLGLGAAPPACPGGSAPAGQRAFIPFRSTSSLEPLVVLPWAGGFQVAPVSRGRSFWRWCCMAPWSVSCWSG